VREGEAEGDGEGKNQGEAGTQRWEGERNMEQGGRDGRRTTGMHSEIGRGGIRKRG
jgi:hypothetical protein